MIHPPHLGLLPLCALLVLAHPSAGLAQTTPEYERASAGTRWLEPANPAGPLLKVLVEPSNLGGTEVSIAEIEFAPTGDTTPPAHTHGSLEIFYVLSGVLDHVVNGESHLLTQGMVGIVRPGDRVSHGVRSHEPVRALVVWAPGEEVERLAPLFQERPIGP